MEAHRQEEAEGNQNASEGGDPGPQPENGPQSDGQLGEGDEQSERYRHMRKRRDEPVDGAPPGRPRKLGLNRRRIRRGEESGISELLQSGETEGESKEGAQWQYGPASQLTRSGGWAQPWPLLPFGHPLNRKRTTRRGRPSGSGPSGPTFHDAEWPRPQEVSVGMPFVRTLHSTPRPWDS